MKTILKNNKAASLVEYGMLTGLISIAAIAGVIAYGQVNNALFERLDADIKAATAKPEEPPRETLRVSQLVAGALGVCGISENEKHAGKVVCFQPEYKDPSLDTYVFNGFSGPVSRLFAPGFNGDTICGLVGGDLECHLLRAPIEPLRPHLAGPINLPAEPLDVALGLQHACALIPGGSVWCWGVGSQGRLGNSDAHPVPQSAPVQAALPGPATAISLGHGHSCALVAGEAWCWGRANNDGLLEARYGHAVAVAGTPPRRVDAFGSGLTAIAAGTGNTFVVSPAGLLGTGSLAGNIGNDGFNAPGALAGNPGTLGAVSISPMSFSQISQDPENIGCGLSGGSVWCWGNIERGDGSAAGEGYGLVEVALSGPATSLAGARNYACAVLTGGEVECWGTNTSLPYKLKAPK